MADSAAMLLVGCRVRGHAKPIALLLEEGRIAWLGPVEDAPAVPADQADLEGRWVLPGLTDSHTHMLAAAQTELQPSLDHCRSVTEMLATLDELSVALAPDDWLVVACERLPTDVREGRLPHRDELDGVRPARPVVMRCLGGHVAHANTAALELAGSALTDVPGDELAAGRLTEHHADALFGAAPPPSPERLAAALEAQAEEYLRLGVTSAVEAAVGFTNGFDEEWAVWERLRRGADRFGLRMGFMLRLNPADALERGLAPGPIDLDWQVRTLKFFADGIVGARTASLNHDYADCPGHSGEPIYGADELASLFASAHHDGWQVAVHAIGDRAIDDVLDAYDTCVDPSRRHRIEHLGLPSAQHIARVERLGLHIATQHGFVPLMGDMFRAALGEDRAQRLFPSRALLDAGIPLAGSSDFPIGPRSPHIGAAGALVRNTPSGVALGAGQELSVAESLDTYLAGGAAIMFQEHLRGEVAVGRAADLAVFDADPASLSVDELRGLSATTTVLRGELAHDTR